MKNTVLLILFLSAAACNSKKNTPTSFHDDVLKNSLSTFNNAFNTADVDILDSMLTANYVHTNGTNTPIGKNEWLSYIKQRKQDILSGKLKVISYEMDQIQIHRYEQTAVVVGRVLSTIIADGEEKSNQFRVTHLWAIQDGTWKRAAFHDGKIK